MLARRATGQLSADGVSMAMGQALWLMWSFALCEKFENTHIYARQIIPTVVGRGALSHECRMFDLGVRGPRGHLHIEHPLSFHPYHPSEPDGQGR